MTRAISLSAAARNGPLPVEVYCSAWFYMPGPLKPKNYWWFVLFRSRQPPYDDKARFVTR